MLLVLFRESVTRRYCRQRGISRWNVQTSPWQSVAVVCCHRRFPRSPSPRHQMLFLQSSNGQAQFLHGASSCLGLESCSKMSLDPRANLESLNGVETSRGEPQPRSEIQGSGVTPTSWVWIGTFYLALPRKLMVTVTGQANWSSQSEWLIHTASFLGVSLDSMRGNEYRAVGAEEPLKPG